MPRQQTVLLVGGTGRTGRRALQQLLDRGVGGRAREPHPHLALAAGLEVEVAGPVALHRRPPVLGEDPRPEL
ncbi:MAG TPA: hypothetical protein VEP68_01855, partial [Anaeromyxobacteraceae bacterium]|nr:hypothetical protein [Anaeromyxobacteraceae bacterium]